MHMMWPVPVNHSKRLLVCCAYREQDYAGQALHGGKCTLQRGMPEVSGCDPAGFGGEMPFNYFCYGAALSEVELDTLTGDFHLLRTDLCMDVGQSLNPAIDIGQVQAPPFFVISSIVCSVNSSGMSTAKG